MAQGPPRVDTSADGVGAVADWTPRTWFALETNTTPLLFGGYALALNVRPTRGPLRRCLLLAGQAGNADFPDWVVNVFRPLNSGLGVVWRVDRARMLAVDYHLAEGTDGLYVGAFNFWFRNELSHGGETVRLDTHIPMARVGYHYTPFRFGYFYLSPWMGLGTEYRTAGTGRVSGVEWQVQRVHYFASVNAGLRF